MKQEGQTKNEILNRSLGLFAEYGYSGTSMSDIAQAVGIQKASLYSHFPGKESIFRALFESILENHLIRLHSILKSVQGSSWEKLEAIFYKYIEYCHHNLEINFWIRFYYFPPHSLKEEILRRTQEVEQVFENSLTALFEQGIKAGEFKNLSPSDMMLSYYFQLIGFVLSLSDYETKEPNADIARVLEVFRKGVQVL